MQWLSLLLNLCDDLLLTLRCMQVPELHILGFFMTAEAGSVAQMRQAAALLTTAPGLVLGKPDSISSEESCLDLWDFSGVPRWHPDNYG